MTDVYPCDRGIPSGSSRGWHHFEASPNGIVVCRYCGRRAKGEIPLVIDKRDKGSELQAVAEIYRAAGRDNPTETVANELGYKRRTAERRIAEARELGLLPPGRPGRP